jgi:hypothetical protein
VLKKKNSIRTMPARCKGANLSQQTTIGAKKNEETTIEVKTSASVCSEHMQSK